MEVVDAAEQADLFDQERILATPTVIRFAPSPRRRVVGDLSDQHRAAVALGLPDTLAVPASSERGGGDGGGD